MAQSTKLGSWQDIKSTYNQQTKGQLQAIRKFFDSSDQPSSVSNSDLERIAAAEQRFMGCVNDLYQLLPSSAQTATVSGYKTQQH